METYNVMNLNLDRYIIRAQETARIANIAAQAAERAVIEVERTTLEADRTSQEADRAVQEADRTTLEANRAAQEAERAAQEANRAAQEADLAAQEAARAIQESERASQEADRAVQEADRATLESERASQEAELAAQELERVSQAERASQEASPVTRDTPNLRYLFTYYELTPLIDSFNKSHFDEIIVPKILERKKTLNINHNINTDNYRDIFITSDIHADYRKLVQILVNAKLIRIPEDIDLYTDKIYDPRIITNSEWILPNSLFIITGDLVDGKRYVPVDDNIGSFELLIHLFLYNIKIKAEQLNSDVLFTIGNHDLRSVLKQMHTLVQDKVIIHNTLERYVHRNAYKYFQYNREAVLSKFYDLSPYLFLNLNNNEIIAVHGGLHNNPIYKNPEINIDDIISIQDSINRNGLDTIDASKFYLEEGPYSSIANYSSTSGILWTRFYADSADRRLVCETIKNNIKQYKLIVVGHCPTSENSNLGRLEIMFSPEYVSCDSGHQIATKGCVLVDECRDKYNAPVLAFVDMGLSQAFRRFGNNQHRIVEILHLQENIREPRIPNRKYNVISRLEIRHNREPIDIRVY